MKCYHAPKEIMYEFWYSFCSAHCRYKKGCRLCNVGSFYMNEDYIVVEKYKILWKMVCGHGINSYRKGLLLEIENIINMSLNTSLDKGLKMFYNGQLNDDKELYDSIGIRLNSIFNVR